MYTKLVLSGGGPRGMALLGALAYAHEKKLLDYIQEYWGTSIGSVISLLLLVGYTPFEIFFEFFTLEKLVDASNFDLYEAISDIGLCPIEAFGNRVYQFVKKKLSVEANFSFRTLYRLVPKKLFLIGANVDEMCGECFSIDTTPDMAVIEAVEISCDLPLMFTRKRYNGKLYVDGGFINNYPIDMADDGISEILGIFVTGQNKVSGGGDYVQWIYRLWHIPARELYRLRLKNMSDKVTHIELQIDNVSFTELTPTRSKKIEIYSRGYKKIRDFFEQRGLPEPSDGWDIEWDWPEDKVD